jgi:diguanylate cyclase (GGDEF)-like protein
VGGYTVTAKRSTLHYKRRIRLPAARPMPSSWSATEIAFLMLAVIQAVFAVIWLLASWLVVSTRRAAAHWAGWAALSSITWVIVAARLDSPPLVGVLAGVIGVMSLQRGIRIFIDREPQHRLHIVLIAGVIVAWWLGTNPAMRFSQAAINFGVLAWLYFEIARDLYLHARDRLRFAWPWLLALPTFLGCVAFGSRALRALFMPESVLTEMAADSALNLGSALSFVVLVLAFHATLAVLVVARLVTELRRLSRHDALTDLLNRRAMEETLEAHIQRSRRSGDAFVVMMLDLDHFKRINDQHGHAVGDLALKHVSALLLGAMRESDHLARFGGEEFVVLMSFTTLEQSQPVAERLRELVASNPLSYEGSAVSLSMSIGVAQWRGAHEDASHLLSRADGALFQAKVQGRNRVVSATGGMVSHPLSRPLAEHTGREEHNRA